MGFMDLGEANYYNQGGFIAPLPSTSPSNQSNTLYNNVKDVSQIRSFFNAGTYLQGTAGFESAIDFDVRASKLSVGRSGFLEF